MHNTSTNAGTAYTVEVLKETMPLFSSLQEDNSSIQSILRPQRLCMKILALATTGPNSPNGSNSVAIVERIHLLVYESFSLTAILKIKQSSCDIQDTLTSWFQLDSRIHNLNDV
ncbi:hypothetical protein TNCV_859001 [Trichonephila clavipes]|nr:hypothetical protein TNCV_859001 [Trichonephila clavipes]